MRWKYRHCVYIALKVHVCVYVFKIRKTECTKVCIRLRCLHERYRKKSVSYIKCVDVEVHTSGCM